MLKYFWNNQILNMVKWNNRISKKRIFFFVYFFLFFHPTKWKWWIQPIYFPFNVYIWKYMYIGINIPSDCRIIVLGVEILIKINRLFCSYRNLTCENRPDIYDSKISEEQLVWKEIQQNAFSSSKRLYRMKKKTYNCWHSLNLNKNIGYFILCRQNFCHNKKKIRKWIKYKWIV